MTMAWISDFHDKTILKMTKLLCSQRHQRLFVTTSFECALSDGLSEMAQHKSLLPLVGQICAIWTSPCNIWNFPTARYPIQVQSKPNVAYLELSRQIQHLQPMPKKPYISSSLSGRLKIDRLLIETFHPLVHLLLSHLFPRGDFKKWNWHLGINKSVRTFQSRQLSGTWKRIWDGSVRSKFRNRLEKVRF